jgi:cation diffusion facilitator family transporter
MYHNFMAQQHAKHVDLMQNHAALKKFAWLSIGAAVVTIALKTSAYLLTGSVGLLSDAIESLVNLVGAAMALTMLIIAARPADHNHVYGHSKAEYFASVTEGILIFGAALSIGVTAIQRLFNPHPLEQLGVGLAVSVAASVINLVVARILLNAGRNRNSITLEADARHLMTDVWTSAGVIGGVTISGFTGWQSLDPLVAILVAINILWTGYQLIRRSVSGLMDEVLPENEQKIIQQIMQKYQAQGVAFHALRTRQAAARRFISMHVLVPGKTTVHDAHHIVEDFENDLRTALGGAVTVFTHLEPIEDELSMDDIYLDR